MKKIATIILSVAAVSSMLFVGCKKDKNVVTLGVQVENAAADGKLFIDENHNPVFFDEGESINVNGTEYSVVKDGTSYTVAVETNDDGNYYACYPASITDGFTGSSSQSITLPRWQSYEWADGRQNVKLPAGAVIEGNSGKKLKFYNFCSLLEVSWNNTSSDDYDIVGIEVTAPGTALCGNGTVDVAGTGTELTMTSTDEKYNRVNLDIPEESRETVGGGQSTQQQYYIVLPPFDSKKITVRVFVMKHNQTTADDQKIRTITIGTDSEVSLPRNYIVPLHITGAPEEDNGLTGYFSVRGDGHGNDTYKVVFSRGNLQCINGTTWKFADRQYDFYGLKNMTPGGYDLSNTQDLFAWSDASNSYFGRYTYDEWEQAGGWTPSGTTGEYFKDWGAYKTISGDAPGTWFTLTADEWYYLFHLRVNSTGAALRGKAVITGVQGHQALASRYGTPRDYIHGFILMPDDWTSEDLPAGLRFTPASESGGANAYVNEYTVEEWARLEAAGAMFLPAAGYGVAYDEHSDGNAIEDTYKTGQYWSRERKAGGSYAESYYVAFQYNDYTWHLQTSSGVVGNHTDANYDMNWWHLRSVRLVKPAPGYTDPDGRVTSSTGTSK